MRRKTLTSCIWQTCPCGQIGYFCIHILDCFQIFTFTFPVIIFIIYFQLNFLLMKIILSLSPCHFDYYSNCNFKLQPIFINFLTGYRVLKNKIYHFLCSKQCSFFLHKFPVLVELGIRNNFGSSKVLLVKVLNLTTFADRQASKYCGLDLTKEYKWRYLIYSINQEQRIILPINLDKYLMELFSEIKYPNHKPILLVFGCTA